MTPPYDFVTSMMLPTIDEDNQVLFNIEGGIEECTHYYDDGEASFCHIPGDCEPNVMLSYIHKENQEFFDVEGDIKQENDTGSCSQSKWIAGVFLILLVGSIATVEIAVIQGESWHAIVARCFGQGYDND